MDLVGVTEIAEQLGVSRARVVQLTARADFPLPVATLRSGRIWRQKDLDRWIIRVGERKPGRPRGQSTTRKETP